MLDFRKPVIDDKKWVDERLKYAASFNCEYTFGNLFIWRDSYRTTICDNDEFLLCRWGKEGEYRYSVPIGSGDFKSAVNVLISDAKANGVKPVFYGVTQHYKELLDKLFPNGFTYEYDEGYNDYIYSVSKMAELKGKKYHAKRNHINNFKKNNPDWQFEVITNDNIGECIDLHAQWIKSHSDDADYSYEFEATLSAFENYDKLGFTGGLIRADSKVIAYTMGEKQSDQLFVTHFEKAPSDVQGAYAIINQEFTKNCLADYEYVNREEDLGIDGLRKAKQSYYPEIFLEKCVAVYNG